MAPKSVWPALIILVAVTQFAHAQRTGWVGEKVMLRSDDIRSGKLVGGELFQVGKPLDANVQFQVTACRNGRLELDGEKGWVLQSQVIRVRDAEAFFTARIQAEPNVGKWYGRRAVARLTGFTSVSSNSGGVESLKDLPTALKPLRFDDGTQAAIRDLNEAVRLDPQCAYWRCELGVYLSAQGDEKAAGRELEAAAQLAPNDDRAHAQFAFHLFKVQKTEEAMSHIDRAIELAPTYLPHRAKRAFFLTCQERWSEAMAEFDAALKIDPEYVNALEQRGVVRVIREEFGEALVDLNRALELDPNNRRALNARMAVFDHKRDYSRLDQDLRRVTELDPTAEQIRGRAFFLASCPDDAMRDGKLAVQLAKKALELAGKEVSPALYATLAVAHATNGEFDKAVEMQEKVIQMLEAEKPVDPDYLSDSRVRLLMFKNRQPYRR